ncbi:MAG TPA: hypothetical protein VKX16_11505 [Chloroflexota bacterium]|nr:hypothetical protein [Chloroflexota bacterium]
MAERTLYIAFPRRGSDLEYVSKHATMRGAAYNTLVSRRRKTLHEATARAIAQLYPGEEYAELIAYHYAKTDAPEAVGWLERADDRAAAAYSTEAVVASYEEARRRREAAGGDDRELARLEEKRGMALVNAGRYEEALDALGRAAQKYQEKRELAAAGRATALLGVAHRWRGTPEEGIALVQPMLELLQSSGHSEALASLDLALANLCFLTGRYAEQQEATARAIGDMRLLAEAEERRSSALLQLWQ